MSTPDKTLENQQAACATSNNRTAATSTRLSDTNDAGAADRAEEGSKRKRGNEFFDTCSDNNFAPTSPKPKARTKIEPKNATEKEVFSAMHQQELNPTNLAHNKLVLRPAPYFYYTNHSLEADTDPLTPITVPGHVPCFPAKMHAILSNPELHDIIAWDEHGRSFRILKTRQFECDVLPRYFEHSKLSSFVRQANGWGFRRFSQGHDRNSYYNEYFLRSMPWLVKKMRRPKTGEKKSQNPDHEPDLHAISREFPVPLRPTCREIQVVLHTIEKGPRARMPVHWGAEALPPAASPHASILTLTNKDPKPADLLRSQAIAQAQMIPQPVAVLNRQTAATRMQANLRDMVSAINVVQHPLATSAVPITTGNSGSHAPTMNLAMLNHFQNLNNSGVENGFAAGFRAGAHYHNNYLREMFSGPFTQEASYPLAPPLFAGAMPLTPVAMQQAAANEYIRLSQLQSMGLVGMEESGNVGHCNRNNARSLLTLEKIKAYQNGSFDPSTSQPPGGHSK
ncbi:hypothetical protein HJC23_006772 [Cyclotella cryptica]|uniref:HSF-type DNA-binding domain-containing protein n=1 Tax=Cyclotella cryptica TaxID=29204 RepID=A0ABD3NQC5_9STRA|eukprot:CCRYP_020809-RA/>CCRYP_020809-RA protein AED:0.05 eAED:0.05 QI:277/1/1/1/1/1/4/310/508